MKRFSFLSALVLVAALGLASCSGEDGPTGPGEGGNAAQLAGSGLLGTSIGSGLLACNPLPYASGQQTIGPAGGTLVIGPHTLTVPAGALSAPVLISGEAPVGSVNSVQLYPEGLQFAQGQQAKRAVGPPVQDCPLLGSLLPKRIAYTTDLLQILSYVLSVDDLLHRRITGSLEHFSRYAVAW